MTKRKPYWKPEVKQIKLAPEEAVLAGCKQSGINQNVNRCGSVAACTAQKPGT